MSLEFVEHHGEHALAQGVDTFATELAQAPSINRYLQSREQEYRKDEPVDLYRIQRLVRFVAQGIYQSHNTPVETVESSLYAGTLLGSRLIDQISGKQGSGGELGHQLLLRVFRSLEIPLMADARPHDIDSIMGHQLIEAAKDIAYTAENVVSNAEGDHITSMFDASVQETLLRFSADPVNRSLAQLGFRIITREALFSSSLLPSELERQAYTESLERVPERPIRTGIDLDELEAEFEPSSYVNISQERRKIFNKTGKEINSSKGFEQALAAENISVLNLSFKQIENNIQSYNESEALLHEDDVIESFGFQVVTIDPYSPEATKYALDDAFTVTGLFRRLRVGFGYSDDYIYNLQRIQNLDQPLQPMENNLILEVTVFMELGNAVIASEDPEDGTPSLTAKTILVPLHHAGVEHYRLRREHET